MKLFQKKPRDRKSEDGFHSVAADDAGNGGTGRTTFRGLLNRNSSGTGTSYYVDDDGTLVTNVDDSGGNNSGGTFWGDLNTGASTRSAPAGRNRRADAVRSSSRSRRSESRSRQKKKTGEKKKDKNRRSKSRGAVGRRSRKTDSNDSAVVRALSAASLTAQESAPVVRSPQHSRTTSTTTRERSGERTVPSHVHIRSSSNNNNNNNNDSNSNSNRAGQSTAIGDSPFYDSRSSDAEIIAAIAQLEACETASMLNKPDIAVAVGVRVDDVDAVDRYIDAPRTNSNVATLQTSVANLATDPLQGAKVYILPVYDDNEEEAYLVDDTKIEVTYSERQRFNEMGQELASFISSMGGSVAKSLDDASHAVWPVADRDGSSLRSNAFSTLHRQTLWAQAQSNQVPIIEANTWLEAIAELRPHQHWSDIDVTQYVPALFQPYADAAVAAESKSKRGNDSQIPSSQYHHRQQQQRATATADQSESKTTLQSVTDFLTSPLRSIKKSSTRRTNRRRLSRHSSQEEQWQMNRSIGQTFSYLSQFHPEQCEEDALQRALELSMLDCALVIRRQASTTGPPPAAKPANATAAQSSEPTPQEILGLSHSGKLPTSEECKAAYRKLARKHHPDKGGSADTFFRIAKAYKTLLAEIAEQQENSSVSGGNERDGAGADASSTPSVKLALKSTAHWDSELQDHRRLVEDLFTSHGTNLTQTLDTQDSILQHVLRLMPFDAGSTNRNEEEELIHNSCFYLSLAASYLHGIGALTTDVNNPHKRGGAESEFNSGAPSDDDDGGQDVPKFEEEDLYLIRVTALQLKRVIEAAVVRAHPEWAASGRVGEEVQAFSDFLVYLLDSPDALLSDWAVVVFDTVSGICDVYQGKFFNDQSKEWQSTNTITIQYLPGHYQPLLPVAGAARPKLSDVLQVLDANSAYYVVTDGA